MEVLEDLPVLRPVNGSAVSGILRAAALDLATMPRANCASTRRATRSAISAAGGFSTKPAMS